MAIIITIVKLFLGVLFLLYGIKNLIFSYKKGSSNFDFLLYIIYLVIGVFFLIQVSKYYVDDYIYKNFKERFVSEQFNFEIKFPVNPKIIEYETGVVYRSGKIIGNNQKSSFFNIYIHYETDIDFIIKNHLSVDSKDDYVISKKLNKYSYVLYNEKRKQYLISKFIRHNNVVYHLRVKHNNITDSVIDEFFNSFRFLDEPLPYFINKEKQINNE